MPTFSGFRAYNGEAGTVGNDDDNVNEINRLQMTTVVNVPALRLPSMNAPGWLSQASSRCECLAMAIGALPQT